MPISFTELLFLTRPPKDLDREYGGVHRMPEHWGKVPQSSRVVIPELDVWLGESLEQTTEDISP